MKKSIRKIERRTRGRDTAGSTGLATHYALYAGNNAANEAYYVQTARRVA